MNAPTTPLQAQGSSRRVHPFLGLAIFGLVSLRGYSSVITSPVLAGAAAVGILLVFFPLAQIGSPSRSGVLTAIPVLVGFGMALYPLLGSRFVKLHVVAAVLERWPASSAPQRIDSWRQLLRAASGLTP